MLFTDISNAEVTVDVGQCVQCNSESLNANVSLPVNTVSYYSEYIICVKAAKEYLYVDL